MLRKWFVHCHGVGAAHQEDIYRCLGCRKLVTHHIIARGGCRCGYSKVSPTNPTFSELCALMLMPWRFA